MFVEPVLHLPLPRAQPSRPWSFAPVRLFPEANHSTARLSARRAELQPPGKVRKSKASLNSNVSVSSVIVSAGWLSRAGVPRPARCRAQANVVCYRGSALNLTHMYLYRFHLY
jgi:hypothetical protein